MHDLHGLFIQNQLAAISKQYDVAFKIYAFERGMEFNIDLEINKGEVIKEEYIEYDNYIWECIGALLWRIK